jgi:hypothetical protein
MRYKRAVEKLRILAETCERAKTFWFDAEPFLKAVYAFGEVVDGADPLDAVQVAAAINLSQRKSRGRPAPMAPTGWRTNVYTALGNCPDGQVEPAVRTYYEIGQSDTYFGARDLLLRRVGALPRRRAAPGLRLALPHR